MNLFSVFDPNALMGLSLNWISSMTLLMIFPSKFWNSKNSFSAFVLKIGNLIFSEFEVLLKAHPAPSLPLISLSFFMFIIANNSLGLIPYVFTASSHLVLTLGMALSCWLGIFVFAWAKNFNGALAHLVPLGSPSVLSPFMVLIELTSSVIRPITLSVRLAANMVAGHLLMTLVSSPMCFTSNYLMIFLIFSGLILLTVLESAVAMIQAYVFSVLSCLYLGEINSSKMK